MNMHKKADNMIKKVAYETAKKDMGRNCLIWFYQPQIPEKVKQLKKNK